jgi:hypothetical protein
MGIATARRRRALIIVPAAGALVASAFVGLPAHAAVTGPIDCPTAFPTASAVKGLVGTGYTVSQGTAPEAFTATVLGRIKDGIGPGVDLIMADLDSPALQAAGGVWAGMSGSPVYTDDGELIGSVSYGLASSSPIAGLTPAETMTPLLTGDTPTSGLSAGQGLPKRIKVSSTQAQSLAKAGSLSVEAASGGFHELTLPVGVSGAPSTSGKKVIKRFEKRLGSRAYFTGGGTASAQVDAEAAAEVHAAGNFAAVLSYGDASWYGVGTTTFVCDGRAVAFGHPFDYSGETKLGANLADTIYVQPDAVWGPFKVANIGSTVGTVNLDSLTGIAATLGAAPTGMAAITTSLTNDAGKTFTGGSQAVSQDYTPDVAAYTAVYDIERALGASSKGSAAVTITIKGKRANGTSFTVTHANKYFDTYNLPYAVADAVYVLSSDLLYQDLEKVSITSVNVTGKVSNKLKGYRATGFKVWRGGAWVTPGSKPFSVKSGGTLTTKVTLRLSPEGTLVERKLVLDVPTKVKAGNFGSARAYGVGNNPWDWDLSNSDTFPELVAALNNVKPSNVLLGDVRIRTSSGTRAKHSERALAYAIQWFDFGAAVVVR